VTAIAPSDRKPLAGKTEVPNPAFDPLEYVKLQLQRPPYHQFLCPQAVRADPTTDTVSIVLPFRPEFRRSPDEDFYHGGVLAALVDIAAYAAVSLAVRRPTPTIDLRIDYLRSAPGVDLTATAKILRIGASVARADVEIVGADPTLLVVGRGTFSTRES
jgi:uncharacterized protein (TIGR00369 family)